MSRIGEQDRLVDLKELSETLVTSYTKGCLNQARIIQKSKLKLSDQKDARLINSISNILVDLRKYSIQSSIEKVLETIDIAQVYEEVDKLESLNKENAGMDKLGYEDFIVKAALKYFKEDFFQWVNKPACPNCLTDSAVHMTDSRGPPSPNPDEISRVEVYQCYQCKSHVEFPRINSPTKLLETRKGRCGEWVNCFMLILKALVNTQIRYVWNAEDHVWCEYFSKNLKRWVHLDPCENVFDEPSLYCENWRKKMSWVIGIGEYYISDLSAKYITTDSEMLPKASVANPETIERYIRLVNASLLLKAWKEFDSVCKDDSEKYAKLYNEVLVIKEQERKRSAGKPKATQSSLPLGRQTGSSEWTASRGEDGK